MHPLGWFGAQGSIGTVLTCGVGWEHGRLRRRPRLPRAPGERLRLGRSPGAFYTPRGAWGVASPLSSGWMMALSEPGRRGGHTHTHTEGPFQVPNKRGARAARSRALAARTPQRHGGISISLRAKGRQVFQEMLLIALAALGLGAGGNGGCLLQVWDRSISRLSLGSGVGGHRAPARCWGLGLTFQGVKGDFKQQTWAGGTGRGRARSHLGTAGGCSELGWWHRFPGAGGRFAPRVPLALLLIATSSSVSPESGVSSCVGERFAPILLKAYVCRARNHLKGDIP